MEKDKEIIKKCNKHGITTFVLEGRNAYRCKKCRVDYVVKRRLVLKQKAVEYKGGKCEICGYNKYIGALEFHHIEQNKDFGISEKGYTRSWDKVKIELDKCICICSNCHKELHAL